MSTATISRPSIPQFNMKVATFVSLLVGASATASSYSSNTFTSVLASLRELLPLGDVPSNTYAPVTEQILRDYIEPVKASRIHHFSLSLG